MRLLLNLFCLYFFVMASGTYAIEEECDCPEVPSNPASDIISTLKLVTDGLYVKVAAIKVNHDGEGELSVFRENGVPKILKFSYENDKGLSVMQLTFENLASGEQLIYENSDIKGKAIVLEKDSDFFKDGNYHFLFKVRSKLNPAEYTTYPIKLEAKGIIPKVAETSRDFKQIVISPGVSMFRWDGTFKKVEFK